MGLINGQLYSAQPEFFTNAGKPAANLMLNRIILVTDVALGQLQISDGTNWVPVGNILGSFATGSLPSAATFPYRLAYDTTLSSVVISNGATWETVGGSTMAADFKANGRFRIGEGADGRHYIPFTIEIINVGAYIEDTGTSGTSELDIKYKATPGGSFATIFSTTPKFTSAANDSNYVDSLGIVTPGSGVTAPVLSVTTIAAGSIIEFDIISNAVAATDCGITIHYRRV